MHTGVHKAFASSICNYLISTAAARAWTTSLRSITEFYLDMKNIPVTVVGCLFYLDKAKHSQLYLHVS